MGFLSYNARFISHMADVMHPIYELTLNYVVFKWTPKCESELEKVKALVKRQCRIGAF
jgi:hypothetical protein